VYSHHTRQAVGRVSEVKDALRPGAASSTLPARIAAPSS